MSHDIDSVCVCVCARALACVRAWVRARARACMCVCVRVYMCVCMCVYMCVSPLKTGGFLACNITGVSYGLLSLGIVSFFGFLACNITGIGCGLNSVDIDFTAQMYQDTDFREFFFVLSAERLCPVAYHGSVQRSQVFLLFFFNFCFVFPSVQWLTMAVFSAHRFRI